MSKHERFIMTPLTNVIEEMKSSTSGAGNGIETYPLWDYILQATFTKMTGFQEQKMKCIDWELATNGYDYRLKFIEDVKNKGTYSKYEVKNGVYNALIDEILRYSGRTKSDILAQVRSKGIKPKEIVQNILENTNIISGKEREYREFLNSDSEFVDQFLSPPRDEKKSVPLLEPQLANHYKEELYRQRNRIAHNTLSYQQNLPDMEKLKSENSLARNYFFWFAILVLIDEIFMELYVIYLQSVKDDSYFDE